MALASGTVCKKNVFTRTNLRFCKVEGKATWQVGSNCYRCLGLVRLAMNHCFISQTRQFVAKELATALLKINSKIITFVVNFYEVKLNNKR